MLQKYIDNGIATECTLTKRHDIDYSLHNSLTELNVACAPVGGLLFNAILAYNQRN